MPRGLEVGVRYVHRDIGRVLEDVQPFPILAVSLGVPGAATANYFLTNPGPATPVVQAIPGADVGSRRRCTTTTRSSSPRTNASAADGR